MYWYSLITIKLYNLIPAPRDTTQAAQETNEYLTESKQEFKNSNKQETHKYREVENPVSVLFGVEGARCFPATDRVTTGGVI